MAEKHNEVIDTYIKGSLPKLDDEDFWNVTDGEYTAHINDKYRIKLCQNEQGAWKILLIDEDDNIFEDVVSCGFDTSREAYAHTNYLWKYKSTKKKWTQGLPHMKR